MSRSTQSEDLSHGLTNCCNFYYVIVKIFIDCWQINDENRHFHSWNQTFTQMKPTTLTYQVKHFYPLIQSLSLKLTIYLVALVWISKESANWLRQYKALVWISKDSVNWLRQYKALDNFSWRRKTWIFKTEAPLSST
jgi:hypothetical protein